ncbi:MAG: hypothetical protein R3305_07235 [Gammaproteobacteria bacterium]|nr:hypothetical protein [Gammaproteobacteria bacterium]
MSNARIIYVTGMKPKPEPALHRPELVRVLGAALARTCPERAGWLTEREQNFVLVSWTSLLYDERRDIGLDKPGIERLLANPEPDRSHKREADRLGRKLKRVWHLLGDSFPWLSALVATAALKVTLNDVHRYLDNQGGLGERIRELVIEAVQAAWADGDRVFLIGHSLGSVIAYDALWTLSRERAAAGRVDVLMTLGSPLATRFIRKGLRGAGSSGVERYPDNIGRWINVAARAEMVALRRRIKPFFAEMLKLGLIGAIEDRIDVYNHFHGINGLDPHKSYGYLAHSTVATEVCNWLAHSS